MWALVVVGLRVIVSVGSIKFSTGVMLITRDSSVNNAQIIAKSQKKSQ